MAYIGSSPASQGFIPGIDYFSGNGSTLAFTLSRNVTSVYQVEVVVDNVIQNPSSAYTVLNNTITFTSAPLTGTNNIWVGYVTFNSSLVQPGAGTVNTVQLGDINSITSSTYLALKTNVGVTAVTIDASQNVGIGTSSPSTKLTVAGSITITGANALRGSYGAGAITTNFAAGDGALGANTTGTQNTAIGLNALYYNTTGNYNTASGYVALRNNTTGTSNTASGTNALYYNTTGTSNTASGVNALFTNTTGIQNTANGAGALYSNTTGNYNTASGVSALQNNTTGASNTASGMNALVSNTTGSNNTASGQGALGLNTTGSSNTASGMNALVSNTTGASNTASGYGALYSNTTGISNTASGQSALYYNTTGSNNTASGLQTLVNNTTGSNNTASGLNALHYNTTGSGNSAFSPQNSAGVYAPIFNPTTENDRVCMGSTGVTNAYIQVAWTVVSDARDKTNFAPVPHGLDFVNQLQPTAYQFKEDRETDVATGIVRYGFKAQDILALEGDTPVIIDTEDLDKLRFNSDSLIPVLVNAIKELTTRLQILEGK